MKRMRMFAWLLAAAILISLFPPGNGPAVFPEAAALSASESNLEYEKDNVFTLGGDLATGTFPDEYLPAVSTSVSQQAGIHRNSWVHAAKEILEISAQQSGYFPMGENSERYSYIHMDKSLSTAASSLGFGRSMYDKGNRGMVSAYLTRGKLGGPDNRNILGPEESLAALDNPASRRRISGISYIPDLPEQPSSNDKANYMNLLKQAVYEKGGAALSLHMDDDRYDAQNKPDNQLATAGWSDEDYFYDYQANVTPDHTVVIVGWDDDKALPEYTLPNTGWVPEPSASPSPPPSYDPGTGAFRVLDSRNYNGFGKEYWLSYQTVLANGRAAYCVNGFINPDWSADFPTLSAPRPSSTPDPFGYTYEYDPFGQTTMKMNTSDNKGTVYYANVFSAATPAASLQAVSVFLMGQENEFEVYYLDEYSSADDLKIEEVKSKGVLVASGDELLPGYYTYPVFSGVDLPISGAYDPVFLPAKGRRFALVAVVTSYNKSAAIPIQSTARYPTSNGRGFASANGDVWLDASSNYKGSICLKAHVEDGIGLDVRGVKLPQSKDKDGADRTLDVDGTTHPLLALAPGSTEDLGPNHMPINANNVQTHLTQWHVAEITDDGAGNKTAGAFDRMWHNPEYTDPIFKDPDVVRIPGYPKWKDEDDPEILHAPPLPSGMPMSSDRIVESPFILTLKDPGEGVKIKTSSNTLNYDKEFLLRVTVFYTDRDPDTGLIPTPSQTDSGNPAQSFEYTTAVKVVPVPVQDIIIEPDMINERTVDMSANSSFSIKTTFIPEDVSDKRLEWRVTRSSNKLDTFSREYDPADPYSEEGPHIRVDDNGRVTAIKSAPGGDGFACVYAVWTCSVTGVQVTSNMARFRVLRVPATGISLSQKKENMSVGSKLTLGTPAIRPANASNKRVLWTTRNAKDEKGNDLAPGDESIVHIEPVLGIVTALKPGRVTVVATAEDTRDKDGNVQTAECEIIVTREPDVVLRIGKSATLKMLGASNNTVTWVFDGNDPEDKEVDRMTNNHFKTAISGNTLKITADKVNTVGNPTIVRALVMADSYYTYDPDDPGSGDFGSSTNGMEKIVIREQIFIMYAVVPIKKLELADKNRDNLPVKKANICIDATDDPMLAVRAESIDLQARLISPEDATMLAFEWTVPDKGKGIVDITVDDTDPTGASVNIKALKVGKVKVTGKNYNSGKKVSINITVLNFPQPGMISTKINGTDQLPFVMAVGKSKSLKSKIKAVKTISKEVRYFLEPAGTPVATVNEKGKVTANQEGLVRLVARGAPFDSTAPETTIVILCANMVKSVHLTANETKISVGQSVTFNASVLPENATNKTFVFSGGDTGGTIVDLSGNGTGPFTFTPTIPGTYKITATAVGNPKKKKTMKIVVTA
ncbi:MAG: lectin like domain-containing protein [Oscillospiraceae bacterium]|nr:lectin like domain-containing protein [Oscillospiraceae bacterium]